MAFNVLIPQLPPILEPPFCSMIEPMRKGDPFRRPRAAELLLDQVTNSKIQKVHNLAMLQVQC